MTTLTKCEKDILILVKTYPAPSKKYVETSCTAGITSDGKPIRIYPIPFRLLKGDAQYKKWQWVNTQIFKNPADHRPESFKADYTSLRPGPTISNKQWDLRIKWLQKFPTFKTIDELNKAREDQGITLGIIKPDSIDDLEFRSDPSEWTPEQAAKLARDMEEDLFATNLTTHIEHKLQKVPYGFYYHYTCGGVEQVAKITDWEISALFFNTRKSADWQKKMRNKYVSEFGKQDVYLILGNQHRFADQWLIIGVIAVPKGTQSSLEFDF